MGETRGNASDPCEKCGGGERKEEGEWLVVEVVKEKGWVGDARERNQTRALETERLGEGA